MSELNQEVEIESSSPESKPLLSQQPAAVDQQKSGFGDKRITFFGGITLLVNNITGPAMVTLPFVYQQAGWFTPTLLMIIVMFISSFSSTMLCKTISLVPGNRNSEERFELVPLSKIFFPKWGYYLTLIMFIISLQALNIASIIVSAQTMDLAFVAMFKYTGAIEMYPHPGWVSTALANPPPFQGLIVISIGFFLVMLCSIPLGYLNLDDNILVQKIAFIALLAIIMEWIVNFFKQTWDWGNLPFVAANQSEVLGTIIFNYAFVTTIPSWVNEKKPSVSVNKTVWFSNILSTALFIGVGVLGALAYQIPKDEDILDVINNHSTGRLKIVSQTCVYLFPIVVLMTGIPVVSIVIRYNLIQTNLCRKSVANFWAVLFPWFLSVFFYTGQGLPIAINWTSLLISGFINFVIPLLLYIQAIRTSETRDEIQEGTQLSINTSTSSCEETYQTIQTEDAQEKKETKPEVIEEAELNVLPRWKCFTMKVHVRFTLVLVFLVTFLVLLAIGFNIAAAIDPNI